MKIKYECNAVNEIFFYYNIEESKKRNQNQSETTKSHAIPAPDSSFNTPLMVLLSVMQHQQRPMLWSPN